MWNAWITVYMWVNVAYVDSRGLRGLKCLYVDFNVVHWDYHGVRGLPGQCQFQPKISIPKFVPHHQSLTWYYLESQ